MLTTIKMWSFYLTVKCFFFIYVCFSLSDFPAFVNQLKIKWLWEWMTHLQPDNAALYARLTCLQWASLYLYFLISEAERTFISEYRRDGAIKIFVTFFSMWTRTYGIRTTYMWQDSFFCILKIWTNKIWPCSEITCKSVCIVLKLLWNWKACPVSHLASLVLALAPPAVQKLTFAF